MSKFLPIMRLPRKGHSKCISSIRRISFKFSGESPTGSK